jgi:DNA-binding transcriptional LysR family regulator
MALRFSLRQLEYFVAVGDCGSIALASEKVNVSSPSISGAIAQLEAEFGLQLFIRRHAQGLTLTQAGRQMMVQAKALLAEADALNRLASDISGMVRGPLSVGCLLTFAQYVLPQVRRSFETTFPDVRLRQQELNQQEIFRTLREGEVDVALTYDLDIPPDLSFAPLVALPPYALLPETHPLAHRLAVSVQDLSPLPMILLDLPYSADYFLSAFKLAGLTPQIAERTRDMGVMKSLIASGFGYGIANIRPLDDLSPDGRRLRFVPLTGSLRPMQLGCLTTTGADAALTVKAFLDHCRASITPDSAPGMNLRMPGPQRDF